MSYLILVEVCMFFFFKQKTAYEMRISDWSSDVCSSDLLHRLTDEAQIDMPFDPRIGVGLGAANLLGDDEVCVLARQPHRAPAECGDPADDPLVDLAREHHLGDFAGGCVGDAQPADDLCFHPQTLAHPPDMRPPPRA